MNLQRLLFLPVPFLVLLLPAMAISTWAGECLLRDHRFEAYTQAAPGAWEFRYGHKGGNYPTTWPLWRCVSRTDDTTPGVGKYLSVEKTGKCAGAVLIGQRIVLPNPVPPLDFAARYQSYCSGSGRSGIVALCVYTEEAWDALPRDPGQARDTAPSGDVFHATVHNQGDDVTSWTLGRVGGPGLRAALAQHAGETVVVAVSFLTWHGDSKEWARLDDLWLGAPLPHLLPEHWPTYIYRGEPVTLSIDAFSNDPAAQFVLEYRSVGVGGWSRLEFVRQGGTLFQAVIPADATRAPLEARASGISALDEQLRTATHTMKLTERPSHPGLFYSVAELARMREKVEEFDWAKAVFERVKRNAAAWLTREFKPQVISGWWWHHYGCRGCGGRLNMEGPHRHVCRSCGKAWDNKTLYHVYWSKVHGDHANAARDLALTYQITGEEAYAQRAIEFLTWYADHYAAFPASDKGGKVVSQTLDECVWLLKIMEAADLAYPAMTQAEARHIERDLIHAGALYTRKYRGGIHNIRCWHNSTWAAAGYFVGDPELVAFARGGEHGFIAQMERGVLEDGMWYERSMGYHSYTVSAISYHLKAAMHAGDDLYKMPQVRKLLTFPLLITFPNLVPPSLNDGGFATGAISPTRLELAAAWYQDPVATSALKMRYAQGASRASLEAWQFGEALPETEAYTPPPSMDLKGAGLAVLRRGTGKDALCAMLEYGEHGGGHGHPDKLQLILYAHGKQICPDLGTTGYANPLHPHYYKTTPAHNTVTIGGRDMAGRSGRLLGFATDAACSAAVATTDQVYEGYTLTRRVLLGSAFLVDEFIVEGEKPDTLDWFLRADGDLATALPLSPVEEKPLSAPYRYLKDLQGTETDQQWSAAWQFGKQGKNEPRPALVVTMRGEPGTQVSLCQAPGGARLAQFWGTLRVRRMTNTTRFIAVHQFVSAGEQAQRVTFSDRAVRIGPHIVDLGSDDTEVPRKQ